MGQEYNYPPAKRAAGAAGRTDQPDDSVLASSLLSAEEAYIPGGQHLLFNRRPAGRKETSNGVVFKQYLLLKPVQVVTSPPESIGHKGPSLSYLHPGSILFSFML